MSNKEYAEGLRLLADWFEAHPDMKHPSETFSVWEFNTKDEAAQCLREMSPCEKKYNNSLFEVSKSFGMITLRYIFSRDTVCTRKVVGTKVIPEHIEPAKEEEIIPEHEEEIYEWECNPILGDSEEKDV